MKKKNSAKFAEVATAVYLEQCRRAVEDGDAELFRTASSRVNAVQAQGWNWQLMQELQQMDAELSSFSTAKSAGPLPKNPLLTSLTVEVK